MKQKQIFNILSREVKGALEREKIQFEHLQEIRLRAGYPVIIFYKGDSAAYKHGKCNTRNAGLCQQLLSLCL